MGIEDGIIEAVATLNLLSFPTSGACEGHTDHGLANPRISFQAPGEPEERYIGENKIKEEISMKYGISIDGVGWGENKEADHEYWERTDEVGETEEYKRWNKENEIIAVKLQVLINEFYQSSSIGVEQIIVEGIGGSAGITQVGKTERVRELKPEEIEGAKQRLKSRQQEMRRFTEFLKKKYFEG